MVCLRVLLGLILRCANKAFRKFNDFAENWTNGRFKRHFLIWITRTNLCDKLSLLQWVSLVVVKMLRALSNVSAPIRIIALAKSSLDSAMHGIFLVTSWNASTHSCRLVITCLYLEWASWNNSHSPFWGFLQSMVSKFSLLFFATTLGLWFKST